jgi:hypothetical protein
MTNTTVEVEIDGVMWTLVIDGKSQRTAFCGDTERLVYDAQISAVIK